MDTVTVEEDEIDGVADLADYGVKGSRVTWRLLVLTLTVADLSDF